jgi:hypothetical protein
VPCLLHKWIPVEVIGRITTYRCSKCGTTKTRAR